MQSYNLFLDDVRKPVDAFLYTREKAFIELEWSIVRSYEEFVHIISNQFAAEKFPSIIAFDHDLAVTHYSHLDGDIPYSDFSEKTGYHCALWLTEFCIENNLQLPRYIVHSMNPAGKQNIISLLEQFKRRGDF